MTVDVFGGTLNLAQSITLTANCNLRGRGAENVGVVKAEVENAGVDKVWKAVRIKYSTIFSIVLFYDTVYICT